MKNEKGFTLIELLAVIVISTTVLVPLLSGLVGNFEVNKRMQARKAASSITLTTIDAFDKIPFEYIDILYQDRELFGFGEEQIMEITQSGDRISCDNFVFTDSTAEAGFVDGIDSKILCNMVFNQQWNNIKYNESGQFRVFIYPYYLDQNEINDILDLGSNPLTEGSVPESVLSEIEGLTPEPSKVNADVFRISVWIKYDDEYDKDIVASGVITRE